MDYSGISKIIEVQDGLVNKYLKLGWTLLFIGQYSEESLAYTHYSLGWQSEKGEPQEPASPYKDLD